MARNTIQKKFTTTEVRGYVIKDGQPVQIAYQLDKKCGLNTAQALIRIARKHPEVVREALA